MQLVKITKQVSVIDNKKTGEAARRERAFNNVSLRSVCKKMGISAAYLSDLENGKRGWRQELVDKFNRAL
jgi:transcriptional regulator with XRE-family HTH domain